MDKTPNAMVGALVFVSIVRFLMQNVARLVGLPFTILNKYLPETNGPSFPRLARLKHYLQDAILDSLPENVEYEGSYTFLVKTNRGDGYLDNLVERIPDSIFHHWQRFGVATMVCFLVLWSVLLLAFTAITGALVFKTTVETIPTLLSFDWTSLFHAQPTTGVEWSISLSQVIGVIPGVLIRLGSLLLGMLLFVALFWVLTLIFLPGVALHEFGHYAAVRRAGASVDSYGLILMGPFLGGAFVQPGDDAEELSVEQDFVIFAAGIANNMILGTALLLLGVLVAPDPVGIIHSYISGDWSFIFNQSLGTLLLGLGSFEVFNGFLNAVPFGPVDGGRFIQTAEENGVLKDYLSPRFYTTTGETA